VAREEEMSVFCDQQKIIIKALLLPVCDLCFCVVAPTISLQKKEEEASGRMSPLHSGGGIRSRPVPSSGPI